MKTTVILILAATLFCLSGCSKSDNDGIGDMSRYDGYIIDGHHDKYILEPIPDKYFIIFKRADTQRILRQLKDNGFTIVDSTYMVYTVDDYDLYVPEILQDCMCTDIKGEGDIGEISPLVYTTHLYRAIYTDFSYQELGASNVFYVGVNSEEDLETIEELARKVNAYLIRESYKDWSKTVFLVCTDASSGNHIELANWFYSTGMFPWAMPEIMAFAWN